MSAGSREVMRYYDGDLSPDEEQALELALENDPELRGQLLAVEQLGDATRVWAEQRSAAELALVDGVMDRIERAERRPALGSVGRALPIAASAFAVAAAVAVLVAIRWPSNERELPASKPLATPSGMQSSPAQRSSSEAAPAGTALIPAAAGPAVAIEAVDFGEAHGSIFVVSSERGDTPVVWLSDEPAISAPRTHPL